MKKNGQSIGEWMEQSSLYIQQLPLISEVQSIGIIQDLNTPIEEVEYMGLSNVIIKNLIISELCNLQELHISSSKLDINTFLSICELKKLNILSFDDIFIFCDDENYSISFDDSLVGKLSSLENLRSLALNSCDLVSWPNSEMPELENLFIYDNPISNLNSLKSYTNLSVLGVSNTSIDSLLHVLAHNSNLREIHCEDCPIPKKQIVDLRKMYPAISILYERSDYYP